MEAFGKYPRSVLFCLECPGSTQTLGVLQKDEEQAKEEFFWMKTVHCPLCSVGWHICLLRTGLRSHMRNQSTLRTHYRLHNKEVEEQAKKRKRTKKIKEPTILAGRIEEQEHESLPYLIVKSLLDATITITNTVVVENGTTMQ
jgi:hypothetical protein